MNDHQLNLVAQKVQKNWREWDFRKIEPEERPMAVAWEYARELKNDFMLCLKKPTRGKPDRFFSPCLHPLYLDFVRSPYWPQKPYQSLSPAQQREAFPRAPWKGKARVTPKTAALIEDITDLCDTQIPTGEEIRRRLFPDRVYDPCRHLLVVDLGANSSFTIQAFKNYLAKKDLLLGPGRTAYERDLSALGALRLDRYFKGRNYTDFLNEKDPTLKSPVISAGNRWRYIRRAKVRLGLVKGNLKDPKPFFEFFRHVGSFEMEE